MKSSCAVKELRHGYVPPKYYSDSMLSWAKSRHYKANIILQSEIKRARNSMFVRLSNKATEGIPCIVVACDAGEYVVQVLSVPGKAGSFVEAIVRPDDPLYSFFHEKVGMLNLAGPNEAIEQLGENFGKGHYNVYINKDQHASICQPIAKE